jgi:hypothetical protein
MTYKITVEAAHKGTKCPFKRNAKRDCSPNEGQCRCPLGVDGKGRCSITSKNEVLLSFSEILLPAAERTATKMTKIDNDKNGNSGAYIPIEARTVCNTAGSCDHAAECGEGDECVWKSASASPNAEFYKAFGENKFYPSFYLKKV